MNQPTTGLVAEGKRLTDLARQDGVLLRLLGGVAIQLRAATGAPLPLLRTCGDLDLIVPSGRSRAVGRFLMDAGYTAHTAFNALNGKTRLVFGGVDEQPKVDVFVGDFSMCHGIPLSGRIEVDDATLTLVDLLLTKLQIVQLTEKDIRDVCLTLFRHDIEDSDGGAINAQRMASLCADDWGLWRTVTRNLVTCCQALKGYDLDPSIRNSIAQQLETLTGRVENEPKSRAWRWRAKVGERKRWYDLPEDPV